MKSLKSYLVTNVIRSHFYYVSLMLFSCFSIAAQASTPSLSTVFSPATIGSGNESLLTYNITNNDGTGVRNIEFTNVLPVGVTIAKASGTTTCSNGILSAPESGTVIALSDASLSANSACTVSVYVTSATVGTHINTTGDLTSDQGNSGTATSNLTVNADYLTYAMAFSPSAISQGEISSLIIDIANPGTSLHFNVATSITLPVGLTVNSPSNLTSTCTGTSTASGSDITLNGSFFTAGSNCQIAVDVVSAMAIGEFIVSSSIATNGVGHGSASASINVNRAFAVMSFDPNPVTPGSTSTLNITLTNYDRANGLTNISFSDDLNAALSGLVATGLPLSNVCGSGSSLTGSSTISLAGGNIAAGGSCTINVPIVIPTNAAQGAYNNTTSTFNFIGSSSVPTGAASNVLNVTNGPQMTMSFKAETYLPGDEALVDFTISNIDTINNASNITFTAAIDQLTGVGSGALTTLPSANSCGTGSTFTAPTSTNGEETFTLSNANILAGNSCSFTVGITLPQGMNAGTYQLSTSSIASTINSVDIIGDQAVDTIVVVSAPSLSFSIVEDYAAPSDTVNAEFTLTHSLNATTSATDIGFTLDLDTVISGLAYADAAVSDVCGVGSNFSGSSILTFSAGTLAAGDSCTFSIELILPANTLPGSYTFSSSAVTATVSDLNPVSLAASDALTVSGLTFTKEFLGGPFLAGDTVVARYTIENSATADTATSMQFTDSFNSVLSGLQATNLPATPCGVSSVISGTSSLSFSNGSLNSGESCSFDVTMLIPASANDGSYISSTSGISATVGGVNTTNTNAVDSLIIESLTVNISSANAPSTSVSPIAVNIDFSRDVVNFIVEDIVVTNGVASNLLGSGASYTVDVVPNADGTITIELPEDAVDDAVNASIKNPAATPLLIEYSAPIASEYPSLAIGNPSQTLTATSNITYQVSYTNAANVNLTSSSINLNKTGTANAQIGVLNGSSDNPVITLSNITGDGTLGVSINAGTARNGVNAAPAQGPSAIVNVDNTQPTVAITSTAVSPSNSAFTVSIDFTDPATGNIDAGIVGFDSSDLSLTNATLSNFLGSNGRYSATINPINDGTATIGIAAGVAQDAAGNSNVAATAFSLLIDRAAPSVVITSPVSNPTNSSFTASFNFINSATGSIDSSIVGFDSSDVVLTNATLTNFTGSAGSYSATITPISEGAINVNIAAGVAQDAAGNDNTAATTFSLLVDTTAPTVELSSNAPNLTNAPFIVDFEFKNPATGNIDTSIIGFDSADISLTNATLTAFTGGGGSYSATITPINEGAVDVNVAAGVAQDAAGNENVAALTFSLMVDTTAPTVAIVNSTANSNSASFTVSFDFTDPATGNIDTGIVGFDSADITLTNASLSNFSGNLGQYSATITPSSDGVVTLDIAAGVAQDSAGNGNIAATTYSVTIDITAPTVAIVNSTANSNSTSFTVSFDFTDPTTGNVDTGIVGFDSTDIALTNASLANFTGNSGQYSATITPISDGVVTLDIAAGVAQDSAGNGNVAAATYSLTIDTTAPVVTITSTATDPINSSFIAMFDFKDPVTGNVDNSIVGFDSADISLTNATLSNFSGNAGSYSATITAINEGLVTLDVAAGVAQDAAGNDNSAATTFSLTVDITSPNVAITVTPASSDNSTFDVSFEFTDPITGNIDSGIVGFESTDISLTNASLTNFSGSAGRYNGTITVIDEGVVTLDVAAGVAQDAAGNYNVAATTFSFVVDNTAPIVTISSAASSPVNSSFVVAFDFTDPATGDIDTSIVGFDSTDISLVNATLTDFTGNSGRYSAVVAPINDGVVTINVPAGAAQDADGNNNTAAIPLSLMSDLTAPSVLITKTSTEPGNLSFTVAFNFTDPITGNIDSTIVGFDSTDILLTNAALTNFSGSAGRYSATVTPTNEGVVTINVAAGVAQDAAGNNNTAAVTFSLIIDNTAPSIAITSAVANLSNSPFTASFVFLDPVTGDIETGIVGFDSSDIILTNASLTNFSGSAGSYSATINPIQDGEVTINVAAGVAQDADGNFNTAANTFLLTYDKTKPTIEITAASSVSEAFVATITFSESILNFDMSHLNVTNAQLSEFNAISSSTFTVLVTPNNLGEVTIFILTGAISDAAGNENVASNVLKVSYDPSSLLLVSTLPETGSSVINDVSISFTFNKPVYAASGDDKLIQIFEYNSTSALHVLPALSSDVVVTNSTVTIATPFTFEVGSSYYVLISEGAFIDDANNSFAGISDKSIFNFSLESDSPIARDDVTQGMEDTVVSIDVLANDSSVGTELDPLTITFIKLPEHGTLTIDTGEVLYQPNGNFFGTDTFSYTVKNLQGLVSNEAIVDITITAVNDIPVFTSTPSLYIAPLSPYVYQVLADDVDSDVLTFNVAKIPSWLSFDGIDTLSGTPTINELDERFEVVITVSDGFDDIVVEQVFSILVTNDSPSGVKISQNSSANPILVGATSKFTYKIENSGVETALLNELTIELTKGIDIDAASSGCSTNSSESYHLVTCALPSELQPGATEEFELSISTLNSNLGEVTSKMVVSEQSTDNEYIDSLTVVISEQIDEQSGELLSASSTSSHAFGDLNADGLIDLVIGNLKGEPNQVLLNTGLGKFEVSQNFSPDTDTRDLALADLNNDGSLDIIIANSGDSASGYYLNNGEGLFDNFFALGTMNNTGVAISDFNKDNLMDIVFSNNQGIENSIFIQPFTSVEYASSITTENDLISLSIDSSTQASFVVTGDFNGDNSEDIAVGYFSGPLEVLLNDGTGGFRSEILQSFSDVSYLVASDINKDDKEDILLSYGEGTAVIMGGENFTNTVHISSVQALSIAVADIDEDKTIDIMLLSSPGVITKYALNEDNVVINNHKAIIANGATGLGLIDVDSDKDIDLLLTSDIATIANEIRYNQGSDSFGAQTVDLSVNLVSVDSVLVNNTYQVTIEVTNSGLADAEEITFDYQVVNSSLVSIVNDSLECDLTSDSLQCLGGTLSVGDSISLVLNLDATNIGVAKHTAMISTANVDDNSANNKASTEVSINEVLKKKSSGGTIPPVFIIVLAVLYFRRRLQSKIES